MCAPFACVCGQREDLFEISNIFEKFLYYTPTYGYKRTFEVTCRPARAGQVWCLVEAEERAALVSTAPRSVSLRTNDDFDGSLTTLEKYFPKHSTCTHHELAT